MTILKTKGHAFPELKEADAMFTSDTAPIWHDGKCCHHCRSEFSFTLRKHHCRNCGQIFCNQCSAKMCTLPKFGIEKEVRVCDVCFTSLQKSSAIAPVKRASDGTTDLPAEYLNSSLAQQAQVSSLNCINPIEWKLIHVFSCRLDTRSQDRSGTERGRRITACTSTESIWSRTEESFGNVISLLIQFCNWFFDNWSLCRHRLIDHRWQRIVNRTVLKMP